MRQLCSIWTLQLSQPLTRAYLAFAPTYVGCETLLTDPAAVAATVGLDNVGRWTVIFDEVWRDTDGTRKPTAEYNIECRCESTFAGPNRIRSTTATHQLND